jgi:gliding motility-associated-like protein
MRNALSAVSIILSTISLSGQYGSPLSFVENKGQWTSEVAFRAEMPFTTTWIGADNILIDLIDKEQVEKFHQSPGSTGHGLPSPLNRHALRLSFHGSLPDRQAIGELKQPGLYHYYLGNDRDKWASRVRPFGGVLTKNLYHGIDWRIDGINGYLKYDLIVKPGADPMNIRLTYEGAERILVQGNELVVEHSFGSFKETVPYAYQIVNGVQKKIPCRFIMLGDDVAFQLGEYDRSKELIIDPTLVFSTFSGSTSDNFGYTATFDDDGFLYSGSSAFGQGYPSTTGAYQTTHAGGDGLGDGTDIAITKYDTTGTQLIWSTFLGGSGDDLPHSLITNSNDETYVYGTTSSPDFPTMNAYDDSWNGGTAITVLGLGVDYVNGSDMIIARLSADGSALLGSTFLGGSGNDGLNLAANLKFNYADEVRGEVLLDDNEDVYIVSCTESTDLPTTAGSFQPGSPLLQEGLIFKFTADLSSVIWGSYLGGSGFDALYSIDIAPNGDLYVAGGTNSSGLTVSPGAIGPAFNGGISDAYVARISSDGTSILGGTYYGTGSYDQAYFVECDRAGVPHIFGQTEAIGPNDLIMNAIYNIPNSGQLVAKFNADLTSVTWSTRFGTGNGTPNISPTAFLVDRCNKIYVSGWGSPIQGGTLTTTGLLSTAGAYQTTTTGGDFYLAVFEDDMSALTYATFFGGNISGEHVDGGTSRFDRRGRVYQSVCAGCGGNSDFPIEPNPGAWSATNNSPNCNNGVFKFDFDAPLVVASFNYPDTVCANTPFTFDNTSTGAIAYQWNFGDTNTSNLAEPTHQYATAGTYTVTLIATDPSTCNMADTAIAVITIGGAVPTLITSNDTTLCGPGNSVTLSASSSGTGANYHWSTESDFSNMLNPSLNDSTIVVTPTATTTYFIQTYNAIACATVDSVIVTVSLGQVELSPDAFICADDTVPLTVTGADVGSTFSWSPLAGIVSGQGTGTIFVNPAFTTNYLVLVTGPTGCTWNDNVTVTVSDLNASSVTATANPIVIQSGNSSQLLATPDTGVTYTWFPDSTLNNPNIADPVATPAITTTYTVIVSDGVCTAVDSVRVEVRELNCDEPDIFVPNAFSPNGDDNNDVLFVRSTFITEIEFKIFDRWGELVFETTDINEGWDGTYKGKVVDPAVFVYYLDAVCADQQTYFNKGNITVVE